MKHAALKPLDYGALALGICAVVAMTIMASLDRSSETIVHIRAEGAEFQYPPDQERTVEFDGPLGTTRVRIASGGVEVLSDPGPQQICVRQGRISEAGQWLACLPNQVFIRIHGDTSRARVDAQSY